MPQNLQDLSVSDCGDRQPTRTLLVLLAQQSQIPEAQY
jgi:hypothetical protein